MLVRAPAARQDDDRYDVCMPVGVRGPDAAALSAVSDAGAFVPDGCDVGDRRTGDNQRTGDGDGAGAYSTAYTTFAVC